MLDMATKVMYISFNGMQVGMLVYQGILLKEVCDAN